MADMKEMAREYRKAAALLALNIKKHEELGDLTNVEMNSLRDSLKQTREVCHILSGYYEVCRPGDSPYLLGNLRTRKINDY